MQSPRFTMTRQISLLLLLVVALLLAVGCDASQYQTAVDPESTEEVLFTVPSGASTKKVAMLLLEAGLVQNDWSFVKTVEDAGLDGKLKAGDFKLSKAMDQLAIATVLAEGKAYVETVKVVIPEGYEFTMIADKLERDGLIDRAVFDDLAENHPFDYRFLETDRSYKHRLEGFLFPATYEFEKGASELEILTAMLNAFDRVFDDEMYTQAEAMGLTINELVTLASIVERESRVAEEFPIIASVFHNRLKVSQKLESCATIQYLLGERKEKLLFKDLEIDSPYNTYKNAGLPPAPIASPGKLALESALNPAETDYYYFVVSGDNDGKHQFSTTYAEHLKAKEKADKKLGN